MAPTVPIVHQPVTVSNSIPPSSLPQRSSSVVMLSDDEQETDGEQGANQYMQPVALQVSTSVKKSTDPSADNTQAPIPSTVITHSSQADKITPVPSSSNKTQLPQQVTKPQKLKKTLTDISRRFCTRIQQKKKKKPNQTKQNKKVVKNKKLLKINIKERFGNAVYQ